MYALGMRIALEGGREGRHPARLDWPPRPDQKDRERERMSYKLLQR